MGPLVTVCGPTSVTRVSVLRSVLRLLCPSLRFPEFGGGEQANRESRMTNECRAQQLIQTQRSLHSHLSSYIFQYRTHLETLNKVNMGDRSMRMYEAEDRTAFVSRLTIRACVPYFPIVVLDMGFAPERVDWALYATKNAGLQPALDHLEANQDGPVPSDYKSSAATSGSSSDGAGHEVSSGESGEFKRDAQLIALHPAQKYDEEDEAALADLVYKKGQQAADDAINNVGEAKVSPNQICEASGSLMM